MGRLRALLAGPIAVALLAAAGIYLVTRRRREDAAVVVPNDEAAAAQSTDQSTFPPTALLHRIHEYFGRAVPLAAAASDVEEGTEGGRQRPISFSRARDLAREPIAKIAEWRPSERTRQVAWDVVDAYACCFLGDLPRSNILSRVLYSTLTRELKSWWRGGQQQKQPQQQGPPPAAAQNGKDAALPPGGVVGGVGGDMLEDLKGLLAEVGQLRAEVKELRVEMEQVRAQIGENRLQMELPRTAADRCTEGSSQPPVSYSEQCFSKETKHLPD